MKKYCRVGYLFNKNQKQVIELFDYNPFDIITDEMFLVDCIECPEDTAQNMYYINGKFIPELEYIEPEKDVFDVSVDGLTVNQLIDIMKLGV